MNTHSKIYLAAPLFSEAEQTFNKTLKTNLEAMGFDVFMPQEDSNDNHNSRENMNSQKIFRLNLEAINNCDIMVAVLDGGSDIDSGTAWEIGYAYSKNKILIGLKTDFRTLGPEGLVNLMIEESVINIETSVDGLIETMKTYI